MTDQANTTVSDEWLRDTAMNVMLATEVEEATRILRSALTELSARRATSDVTEAARLRSALDRQCDNMAFVINHIGMPDAWLKKFMHELDEDRAALSQQAPE